MGRLIDYFFQCGLSPGSSLSRKRMRTDSSPWQPLTVAGPQNETPASSKFKDQHPIDYTYHFDIQRYPEVDYEDSKFPSFLGMFCSPTRNLKFAYEDDKAGPPESTFHSFGLTEENGQKSYGMAVQIWEKLPQEHLAELEAMINNWKTENLAESDYAYFDHIKNQKEMEEEAVLTLHLSSDENKISLITEAEEKLTLYREILAPINSLIFIETNEIYAPRFVGLLSRWPFYDFMKDWICSVLKLTSSNDRGFFIPLERYVANLLHEVPCPPPGRLEVSLKLGIYELFVSRPPVNASLGIKNFSLYPVFCCLSVPNFVTLFELALNEAKILFISSTLSLLNLSIESLLLVLFPLSWPYVSIPLLPLRLAGFLQSPLPFLIGITRETFEFVRQGEEGSIPDDVCIVDLDNDSIRGNVGQPLPHVERKKLLKRLHRYGELPPDTTPSFHNDKPPMPSGKRKGPPANVQFAFPEKKLILSTQSKTRKAFKPTVIETMGKSKSFSLSHLTALSENNNDNRREALEFNCARIFGNESLEQVAEDGLEETVPPPVPRKNLSPELSGSSVAHAAACYLRSDSIIKSTSPSQDEYKHTRPNHKPKSASLDIKVLPSKAEGSDEPTPSPNKRWSFSSLTLSSETFKRRSFNAETLPISPEASNRSSHFKELLRKASEIVLSPEKTAPPTIQREGHAFRESPHTGLYTDCNVCREKLGSRTLQCDACTQQIHFDCLNLAPPCPTVFKEDKIQSSFLKLFTSLFRNYRTHLLIPNRDESLDRNWFAKKAFLEEFDKDSLPFMTFMVETLAFQQFAMDRLEKPSTAYDVLFFDECIKTKLNRSVVKLRKDETPFLKDNKFTISKIYHALQPTSDGIPKSLTPPLYLPFVLDSQLLGTPRCCEILDVEHGNQEISTYAHELVEKIRQENRQKRKRELNEWLRSKIKSFNRLTDNETISFGLFTEEERCNLFESRLQEVSGSIDSLDFEHDAKLSTEKIKEALEQLHALNLRLMTTADEEQLVDGNLDRNKFKDVYSKLFTLIAKYEDLLGQTESRNKTIN